MLSLTNKNKPKANLSETAKLQANSAFGIWLAALRKISLPTQKHIIYLSLTETKLWKTFFTTFH